MISRRTMLAGFTVFPGLTGIGRLAGASKGHLKIGVTDWNLKLTCKIEAVAMAKNLGFDGVQVSIGRVPLTDNKMPMDDAELIARYREESKKLKMPLDGTCLDR